MVDKSTGYDDFHLKVVTLHLQPVNQERSLPDDMKIADSHTKGPEDVVENYRPNRFISIGGKNLESIIADRILAHTETDYFLAKSQHGFLCE